MMTKLFSIVAVSVLAASTGMAQLLDVDISAARKKLDEQKSHENNTTVITKEVIYKISLESHTSKPLNNLVVKYMIFYEDPQQGSREKAVAAFHKGSQTVATLGPRESTSLESQPFTLTTEQLDGGWVYASGASGRSQDRVIGVWIRAYVDGKIVGEYANPTTVSKKNPWKD